MKLHPLNVDFAWKPTTGPFRRLSAEQAHRFDERGYLLLERALSLNQVSELAREIDGFEARFRSEGLPGEIMFADDEHTSFVLRLAARSPRVRELCFTPSFCDLVADLVGPDAWMHYDHAVYKRPNGSLPFFWHQDNAYPFIEPQQKRILFWIALTDTSEDNGCLWLDPGGHLAGTLEHENNKDGWICYGEAPPTAIAMPISAGDMLVYSALLPHFSGPNRSNADRKALSLGFVPDGAYAIQMVQGKRVRVPCANGLRVLTRGEINSGSV